VLRLGNTEFILEQDDGDSMLAQVQSLARTAGLRAWPVTRADCSLLLSGEAMFDRLSRVCAYDFAQFASLPDMAVMTAGDISVTLRWTAAVASGRPRFRHLPHTDPAILSPTPRALEPHMKKEDVVTSCAPAIQYVLAQFKTSMAPRPSRCPSSIWALLGDGAGFALCAVGFRHGSAWP
jgi:hypothetical protein